jgi:low affinity Fe/Cu permease
VLCVATILVWGLSGPLFHFSDTWQLVINTGTTIVTFLMVFLIQNTQNRDGAAIQVKLDELIRTSKADNEYIGVERLTDEELESLHVQCEAEAKKTLDLLEKAKAEKHARHSRRKKAATPNAPDPKPARPRTARRKT